MRINIDFTDLFDIVRRSLSVIGKRSVDDQGNPLFKDITIGTNEREVVNDWLTLGMSNLVTEVSHHVDVEQYNNGIVNTIYTDWWQDDDVSTSLITASGQYWYKPSTKTLYVSSFTPADPEQEIEQSASWSEATPATDTAYVDGAGRHYWWHNDTMERIGTGVGGSVTLDFDMPDNWNSAIEPSLITSMQNYLVSFTLYSWFVISAPKIAEKYGNDAAQQLGAVIRMFSEKKPPVEDTDILSTTTSVT